MSDAVKIQLGLAFITAFFAFLTPVCLAILGIVQVRTAKEVARVQKRTARANARKVERVAKTLEAATGQQVEAITDIKRDQVEIKADGKKALSYVNSLMEAQLRKTAELSRWKAEKEPNPINLRAAELDEKLLADHVTAQTKADSLAPTVPPAPSRPAAAPAPPGQLATESTLKGLQATTEEGLAKIAEAVRPPDEGKTT